VSKRSVRSAPEFWRAFEDVTSQNAYDYRGHEREIWAAHYLSALAKALMEDAELGMMR